MIDFIKKNLIIGIVFIITLFLAFLTFLTFIDKSFIELSDKNLQLLLIGNVCLLLILFLMIFMEVRKSLKIDVIVTGSRANKKYITFFDKATAQWEILETNSEYIPPARWKAVFQLINDKLYVLGGRNTPKESANKDIVLNDIFSYDFIEKKFINLGKINPKIPLKYSYGPHLTIKNKKAYLKKDQIVFFDFKNDSVTSFFQKNLFEGIDLQRPAFEHLDTIYYLKKNKKTSLLVKFPVKNLNNINPTFFYMFAEKEVYFEIVFVLLSVFLIVVLWTCFKLFAYKDFLKESLLFDENKIHYGKESYLINEKQLNCIKHLEKHSQISVIELNKIISSKKYAKSHLTFLRTDFIKRINEIYKKISKSSLDLIEQAQDPSDKRYKFYTTTKQVSEKESFVSFLFKF